MTRRFALLLALVLSAAACSGDDSSTPSTVESSTTSTTTTATTTTPAPPVVDQPLELSVAPSVDLVDGDVVTVTARGLASADIVVIGQCLDIEPLDLGSCDPLVTEGDEGDFVKAQAGAIDERVTVAAQFVTANGTLVDCREPATDCVLVVSSLRTPTREDRLGSTLPISFDPEGELLEQGASLSPDTDLVDGQALSLSLWGLEFGNGVFAGQCVGQGADRLCDRVLNMPRFTVDIAGRVDVTLWAQAEFSDIGGTLGSCRGTDPCVLVVESGPPNEDVEPVVYEFPLSFDPDAPLATAPRLRVEPSSGVRA